MAELAALIAAHPLRKKPYNTIKFVRIDQHGTPLYSVGGDPRITGARSALKTAFERFGAHCFHCKVWMRPQALSHCCTRDHVRARASGGADNLYNFVFSCGTCNRAKGRADLIAFNQETGAEYLLALAIHLDRCIAAIARQQSTLVKPPSPIHHPAGSGPAPRETGVRSLPR